MPPAEETSGVGIGMKHRWIGGLLLAVTVSLAACAPGQGAGESAEASDEPLTTASAAPSTAAEATDTPEPIESAEASESPEPTPDDYEY